MSTFKQDIGAGESIIFPGAEQFHLLEADDPIDITFYSSRSQPLETWEKMKGGFRIAFEKGFIQVKVESATAQTVKIALTSGQGEYDRSQGDVSVTNIVKDNSWCYDSLQKKAFIGSMGMAAPGSTVYGHVQLWNPNASGVNLIVTSIKGFIEHLAATFETLRYYATALSSSSGVASGNKWLNEASPNGQILYQVHDSRLGTIIHRVRTIDGLGTIDKQLKITGPIIIPPNMGLIYVAETVNIPMGCTFEWTEDTA